jgi:uncharacterized protein (TIRG00374 family)
LLGSLKKKILVILRFIFFLGIGIFFIWLFLRNLTSEQKNDIINAIKIADYSWIILALVLGLASHWVRAVRWRLLMEPLGYKPKKINVFIAVIVGYLANLALPRLGEVSRCGVLTRTEKIPFNQSFGTVITERVIDILSFIILFFLMLFTMSSKISSYVQVKVYEPMQDKLNLSMSFSGYLALSALFAFLILLALVLAFRKKLHKTKIYAKYVDLIKGFVQGMKSLTRISHPYKFFTYTVIIWILYLLMSYVVFFSLPETSTLSIGAGLVVLVFGSIGGMLVQGGIGIYPAIVAETLSLYAISATTGYAMGWLIWSSQNVMILIGGLFSLLLLNTFKRKGNDKSAEDRTKDTQQSDLAPSS